MQTRSLDPISLNATFPFRSRPRRHRDPVSSGFPAVYPVPSSRFTLSATSHRSEIVFITLGGSSLLRYCAG